MQRNEILNSCDDLDSFSTGFDQQNFGFISHRLT